MENRKISGNAGNYQNLIKGSMMRGLLGPTIGFFVGFAAVSLYGPTATIFKHAFHGINPILLAMLVSAPSLSGSLLRIPFSAWVDTTGGKKPFLVLLILSIIGMAGLYYVIAFQRDDLSNYYWILFLLGILSGCGIATFSVGVGQTSYWFPQNKQGWALGFYAGVGNLAPGIFSILLPFLALPILGLSGSYLAWLIFLIVGTIVYAVVALNAGYFQLKKQGVNEEEAIKIAKENGQELFPTNNAVESLIISAKAWRTWPLVIVYFTTFGGFLALTSWFPNYWMSYFKFDIKTAGLATAYFSLLTSLIRIWGGTLSDKFGGEIVSKCSLVIAIVGSICLTFAHNLLLAFIGLTLLAIGMGIANAAVFKIVPKAVPEAVGGAAGWIGGVGAFGGFVIPPIMATFISGNNNTGFPMGFSVFVGLTILSFLMVLLFKNNKNK